jgi:nucleotide-binding universal stress UspA family protein
VIKRLLVPLDGSDLAEEALVVAGDLAESVDGVLVLARVVPPPVPGRFYAPNLLEQVEEAQAKEAEAYLASVAARLKDDRLHVETRVTRGEVASTLAALAEKEHCELIVMGSHGLGGVGWHVFGSVAQKLLHTSPRPVLIVRPGSADVFEREEESEERVVDEAMLSELAQTSKPGDA